MRKYTQKGLRELVRLGMAIDITNATNDDREAIEAVEGYYTQVGYSEGVYGCNGMLLQGYKTGQLYAITTNSQAIYVF